MSTPVNPPSKDHEQVVDSQQERAIGSQLETVGNRLVTVSGQAALAGTRDTQRTANLEAGSEVLADNVDDVVRGGVPSRATELDLSGGRLSLGSSIEVTVRAESGAFEVTRTIRPVVYRADSGAELVYANGAVIIEGKKAA